MFREIFESHQIFDIENPLFWLFLGHLDRIGEIGQKSRFFAPYTTLGMSNLPIKKRLETRSFCTARSFFATQIFLSQTTPNVIKRAQQFFFLRSDKKKLSIFFSR